MRIIEAADTSRYTFDDAQIPVGAVSERAQPFWYPGLSCAAVACATLANSMTTMRSSRPPS